MTNSTRTAAAVLDAHRDAGETFTAGGIQSFLRAEGDGEPVVCIHGMLGSSFGYRKVLRELASRGLRGIAWDLPGFGLAERPQGYGEKARAAAGLAAIDRIPGKHFPQEDQAPAIATRVASLALARKRSTPD